MVQILHIRMVQVKDMQDFRRSLPEKTRLIVCKNSLIKQAVEKAPDSAFGELGQAAQARSDARVGCTVMCSASCSQC